MVFLIQSFIFSLFYLILYFNLLFHCFIVLLFKSIIVNYFFITTHLKDTIANFLLKTTQQYIKHQTNLLSNLIQLFTTLD
jgi:hypothetical protein